MDILICPVEKNALWICAQCFLGSPESTLVLVQESQSQLNWTALIAAPWATWGELFEQGNMHQGNSHAAIFKVYIFDYSWL